MAWTERWQTRRLEEVATVNPESLGVATPASFEFSYIDITSVSEGTIDWDSVSTHHFGSAPSRARRVVRPNDVLLCTVRPGLRSHTFARWPQRDGIICSTGFAVIRSGSELEPRFLAQLVFDEQVAGQLRKLEMGSSYPAVNESDVRNLTLVLPPRPVQSSIADILDSADAAIRETEAVIAKLKPMKVGLLHDLLTCGLDEHGRLRTYEPRSPHFRDVELGTIFFPRRERGRENLPVMAVTMRDGLQLRDPTERRVESRLTAQQHLLAKKGDIAYNMMRMWQGACGLAREDCLLSPAYVVLEPRGIDSAFAYRLFKSPSTIKLFHNRSRGLTDDRLRLYYHDFSTIPVRIPRSVKEQARIAAILDAHDGRIEAEETQLLKLKLQKQGLMHDLLSGRVRVDAVASEVA